MKLNLVTITIWISLALQLITTILPIDAFRLKLHKRDKILKDILGIETIVQIVEFTFYFVILFAVKDLNNYTSTRYFDWFITTPIMLFSTILFMKYKELKENNIEETFSVLEFIKQHKQNIIKLFVFNALMLVFGYLGEKKILPLSISTTIGFIFFYLAFHLIYKEYAVKSKEGIQLFWFVAIVWSLYGVAALTSVEIKNISYNFLDVISKNFYGLFIYYKVTQVAIK